MVGRGGSWGAAPGTLCAQEPARARAWHLWAWSWSLVEAGLGSLCAQDSGLGDL